MSLSSTSKSSKRSHPQTSLTTPTDDVEMLGKTGDTVVYIFPSGGAIADREEPDFARAEAAIVAHPSTQSRSEPADLTSLTGVQQYLDTLVAAAHLTANQKAVALYDYQSTGMDINDILAARGWGI